MENEEKRMNNSTRGFGKNVLLSLLVQFFSLGTSFILGFIVPKAIDEYQYAYWQMFVLYIGYVGILNFGLLDGIVLRYSQYDYEALDKRKMRSQFRVLLFMVTSCCSMGFLMGCFGSFEPAKKSIICLVSIGIITKNVFGFSSYAFQITNRIDEYAKVHILQRFTYAILIVGIIILQINDFRFVCVAEMMGDVVGIIYSIKASRQLFWGSNEKMSLVFKETKKNICAGIFLMIANLSAALLLGGAKIIIEWRWDALLFGKVSFAFSVSSLFLVFVSATSVVLFPSLKRLDVELLPNLYMKLRKMLSLILFSSMAMYFFLAMVLKVWLPNYAISMRYLGIILPMIIFSAKNSLLTDNYLKAYRKEKILFRLNFVFMVLNICFCLVSAYLFNSIDILLLLLVLVVMLKSVFSEICVMRTIEKVEFVDFFVEFLFALIFILCTLFFELYVGIVIYAIFLIIYLVVNRKILNDIGNLLKRSKLE